MSDRVDLQYVRHPKAPAGSPPVAVRFKDFVFSGGHVAADPVDGVPPEALPIPGRPFHGSPIERQTRFIFDEMAAGLLATGSSMTDVMKINSYHVDGREADMALRVRRDYFGGEYPPPSTLVLIEETEVPQTTLAIDVIALATDGGQVRVPVVLEGGQVAITEAIFGRRVFIQAAKGGGLVFTVGVGPRDMRPEHPESLPLPGHPSTHQYSPPLPVARFPYRTSRIEDQTDWVLSSLQRILEAAGTSFEHVVRAEVHLSDMRHLAGMNRVWERYFPTDPPARVVVPTSLARPDVMLIEIELIAIDPDGPYKKETIHTTAAPTPLGPQPQAVRAGPYLFLSGQLATDYETGIAPDARVDPQFPFHSSAIERQAAYILDNVEAICQAGGTSIENLLRRRAVHVDLADLPEAESVWQRRVGSRLPPTTVFKVAGPLEVPGCQVQYDLIAGIPDSTPGTTTPN